MNKTKNIKIILGISYILIISIFLWFFFQNFSIQDFTSYELIKANRETLEAIKSNNIFLSSLLFFLGTIIWVLLLGFGSPIFLVGGFIFGKWLGTLLVVFGLSTGATLLYIIAYFFFKDVNNLDEFELRSNNSLNGVSDYEPGYIQVYCEGAAQRYLGNSEKYDKLILFTKNVSFDKTGEELKNVHEKIKQKVFQYISNPSDCVKSIFLTPKDMKNEFYFPGGNIDHVMLTQGQNLILSKLKILTTLHLQLPLYQLKFLQMQGKNNF